jgi:hypothetical protein
MVPVYFKKSRRETALRSLLPPESDFSATASFLLRKNLIQNIIAFALYMTMKKWICNFYGVRFGMKPLNPIGCMY